jgi:hypothetical protein
MSRVDPRKVEADLFNENGKWKYHVVLDYDGGDHETWDLWSEAEKALSRATEQGISGVTLSKIPNDWMLVVLEPYGRTAHPIMVTGGRVRST